MTTSFRRESAKLYEFPTRARILAGNYRAEVKTVADLRTPLVSSTSFGSGWYHEAAVQASDQTVKP